MEKYHLTLPQYDIYRQEVANPGTNINVLYFVANVKLKLNATCLNEAINFFLQGNTAARLQIRMEDGIPMQVVKEYTPYQAEVVDACGWNDEQTGRYIEQAGQEPFLFEKTALYAFKVLDYGRSFGLLGKFHHIWMDGWSVHLIFECILNQYLTLINGKESDRRYPDYREFIKADEVYQTGALYKEDERFWEEAFRDFHDMPYIRKTLHRENRIGRITFSPDREFSKAVRVFARDQKISPYVLFVAAMGIYTGYVCDQEDMLISVPRLNRDRQQEREMVGMFVMNTPVLFSVKDQFTFLELCAHVEKRAREVAAHKKYPLSRIIKIIQKSNTPEGRVSQGVSYHKKPVVLLDDPAVKVDMRAGMGTYHTQDVMMHIWELPEDEYTVFYDYSADLFTEDDMKRFHDALMHVITLGIKAPDMRCGAMQVLSDAEREKLAQFNETDTDYDRQLTIDKMFAEQVKIRPDAVALRCGTKQYTYKELDQVSDGLADMLIERGLRKGDIAAILLPRSEKLLISMLGIIKAGGAFTLLDDKQPEDRIRYILKNCETKYLITSEKMDVLTLAQTTKIDIEDLEKIQAIETTESRGPAGTCGAPPVGRNKINCEDLCFISYTSGTTGNPKGAMNTHQGVVNLCHPGHSLMVDAFCQNGSAVLSMGNITFDAFLVECLPTLLNGIAVTFTSEDELNRPELLAKTIITNAIDILIATPSRIIANCKYPAFTDALRLIKIIVLGGEKLEPVLVRQIGSFTEAKIINAYGPTEAAVSTSYKEVQAEDISIGKAIANFKTFVVGKKMQPLPIGTTGELCIGGIGLARGYVNQPDLTAEKFITLNGVRVYKTGDLVYCSQDGELHFIGRSDNQVKLRGFRIELSEIEQKINQYENIVQSVVLVKKTVANQMLCAFFTAEKAVNIRALKKHLAKYLPYYMLPGFILQLEHMPVTKNGKTDQRALLELEAGMDSSYEPPENQVQRTLLDLFIKILEKNRIGIDHDFFDMGGDSLSAARLVVEAGSHGIPITYQDVFNNHTVRQLCLGLDQDKGYAYDAEVEDYDYRNIEELLRAGNKQGANNPEEPTSEKNCRRILLTGATGYLGAHILYELIENTNSIVYCLARPKGKLNPEQRIKSLLFYYFEADYQAHFGKRIFVITGDMTKESIFDEVFAYDVDTVINSAADVAHYSFDDTMERTNVGGIKNLIAFCKKNDSHLIHISTISVGQMGFVGHTSPDAVCDEKHFYFKQDLSNKYIRTKFLAERCLLEAIQDGLSGKIIRVGNLQGRFSDGEFQINSATNRFTGSLKAYAMLGLIAKSIMDEYVDYSPVDYVAKGIVTVLNDGEKNIIYQLYNEKGTRMGEVIQALESIGYPVQELEDRLYGERIRELMLDEQKREKLYQFLSEHKEGNDKVFMIRLSNRETVEMMRKHGFEWPQITKEYLFACVSGLEAMGFFDE